MKKIGFLTYDLQPFTADCLGRIAVALNIGDIGELRAYPVFARLAPGPLSFKYRPSRLGGRFFAVRKPGSTPEGFTSSINWGAARAAAWESDVLVLFGIQGGTAILATIFSFFFNTPLISVNQTLPPAWEGKRRWWVRLLKGWILRRCRLHIVQTPVSRDTLTEIYGIDPSLMVDAPFEAGATLYRDLLEQVEEGREKLRFNHGWDPGMTIFLFVGTLLKFKGLETLLAAAAAILKRSERIFKVVCVGDAAGQPGEWSLDEYRQQAAQRGILAEVIFPGPKPMEALAELYTAADVCVLPTRKDTWGKVLVEAGMAGLPLITTDACGAAGTLVVAGESGFVIPPNDPEALAVAMEKLLDPDLRERLGVAAERICRTFSDAEKETRGYLLAIERVLMR